MVLRCGWTRGHVFGIAHVRDVHTATTVSSPDGEEEVSVGVYASVVEQPAMLNRSHRIPSLPSDR